MPCNSDYMSATTREVELSRVACLMGEIAGSEWKKGWWRGYHPDVYGKRITKDEADTMVLTLCARLRSMDVSKYSLEMQIWWRDHQRAYAARLQCELAKSEQDEDRRKATAKLTPYERKLLGL